MVLPLSWFLRFWFGEGHPRPRVTMDESVTTVSFLCRQTSFLISGAPCPGAKTRTPPPGSETSQSIEGELLFMMVRPRSRESQSGAADQGVPRRSEGRIGQRAVAVN